MNWTVRVSMMPVLIPSHMYHGINACACDARLRKFAASHVYSQLARPFPGHSTVAAVSSLCCIPMRYKWCSLHLRLYGFINTAAATGPCVAGPGEQQLRECTYSAHACKHNTWAVHKVPQVHHRAFSNCSMIYDTVSSTSQNGI